MVSFKCILHFFPIELYFNLGEQVPKIFLNLILTETEFIKYLFVENVIFLSFL